MKKLVSLLVLSVSAFFCGSASAVEMRPVMTLDVAKKWRKPAKKKRFKKVGA